MRNDIGSALIGLFVLVCGNSASAAEQVSFRHDVMAVLSRSGCNQGACHGNLNGKGGFKLSLRGEDPNLDLTTLTREGLGRRVSSQNPDQSLLLRKASGGVPHEGGIRFSADALEYHLLRQWIAGGCPEDAADLPTLKKLEVSPAEKVLIDPEKEVRISVRGHFSDGSVRDLSRLACYDLSVVGVAEVSPEGVVRRRQDGEVVVLVRYLDQQVPVSLAFIPQRKEFAWKQETLASPIDRLTFPQWKSLRLTPSPDSDDSIFLRRVFLDTLGILPSPGEVRAFLKDDSPQKRDKLIDSLLVRPEFADYWSQKWADVLRNEEKSLDRKGVRVFHQWIRDAIDQGMPLNEFARQVISGRGSTYASPAANFYRAIREPYARSEAVAQVFLGIRLQCAKCHNHPFDRWTQNDYHQFAAFFAQVDYRIMENNRRDKLDSHEFDGEQVVYMDREKQLLHPRSKQPLQPRLLNSEKSVAPDAGDRLIHLADWIADPKNPFFARAQVNRIWFHLMGRGLVEPNDDFRIANPPINAPLLDWLTSDFAENHFDLRHTVAIILKSRTYQLSSAPGRTNSEDETHFSHAMIQPLEAEQLLDGISQVLNVPLKFTGYPKGTRAGKLPAPQLSRRKDLRDSPERFLRIFGKPERLMNCDCERSDDSGLMQAFQLLNGELLHDMLVLPDNRIGRLLTAGKSDAEIIEFFWQAALSRNPTKTESQKLQAFIAKSADRRTALEDVVWGLLNSREFLLRR